MAQPPPPRNLRKILSLASLAVAATAFWSWPEAQQKPSPFPKIHAPSPAPVLEKSAPTVPSTAPISPPVARTVHTPPLPPAFANYAVISQDQRPTAQPADTELRRIVHTPFKFAWFRLRSIIRDGLVVSEEAVVADQLLVTLQPDVAPAALAAALKTAGITVREKLPGSDTLLLQLPDHELDSVDRARAELEIHADLFRSVDPNGIGFGAAPNDPRFVNQAQWSLKNTGQSGGVSGADVNAVGLWSIVASAPKVLVAIIDSGMDFTHEDLAGVAWTNPGEIAGNALDDDNNGRIDDVNGWDFVNADNLPADDHNHGSHVTGILAARRDNSLGIAGMADPVAVLPVKILNSSNLGATSDFIAGLDYARLLGARVMNLSLQNFPNNASLQSALDRAEAAGIVICACAGNQGVDNDLTPNYPSSFANANIIAVGNHDRTDARWAGSSASNFGATSVDIFAPGRDVISTVRGNTYVVFTGTSMSCPHVTAVAAIIRALNPTWTPADVKSCLLATATTRPAYTGICVSNGRLDAQAAVARAIRLVPDSDPDGDSAPSLFEYALGLDPLRGNAGGLPAFQISGATLEFTYPRVRLDVSYSVEASDDFVAWSSAIVNQGGAVSPITATAPAGVGGQRFLRLKIGLLP